jgi:hypothetical protein
MSRSDARGPAFYATGEQAAWRDLRAVLHPPYTAWHLSYVVLGAMVAPRVNWTTLLATLLAFFLAVGVCAHALDELRGRPLGTRIPSRVLWGAAALGLAGAVALGVAGVDRVGAGLVVFIVVGAVLVLGYNLELFGPRVGGVPGTDLGLRAVVVAVALRRRARSGRDLHVVGPAQPLDSGAPRAPPGHVGRRGLDARRRTRRADRPSAPAGAVRTGPAHDVVGDDGAGGGVRAGAARTLGLACGGERPTLRRRRTVRS